MSLSTLRRPLLFSALLASAFFGGCEEAPPPQSTSYACESADDPSCPTPALADVEVVLTEPFCDVCTPGDKEVLQARSPIVAEVVTLIDAASTSVDVAQYTFSVREIAEALARAHERGVSVRLAMDVGQDREGTRARELHDAGVDVRFVSGKPYGERHGLQHAKFMIVDGETLLTGSNNFSSTGTSINEENTIVLRDAASHPVLEGFRCHFDAIWEGEWQNAGACSNEQAHFTPGSGAMVMLRDAIRGAHRRLDVIMHHLTFDDLVEELTAAAERGVQVRLLLNETTREEHSGARFDALIAAGARIRYKQVNEDAYQLLHHKLVIVDDRQLINGSGNWSGSGFFNNFENYVVWDHPRVVQPFRGLYHRLWTWSLSAAALDAELDAASQHMADRQLVFGNLHAHFHARDGGRELDDGKPEILNEAGEVQPVEVPEGVFDAAAQAFAAGQEAGLDFMALSPHCRDEREDDHGAQMTQEGFVQMADAAAAASDAEFRALAGMEWSTNSTGNHVGIVGSSQISKVERGRFDLLYEDFLLRRELAGERPLVMLNHPKTFRTSEETLNGSWDMIFGVDLLEIPKAGDRSKKFNDFGIDDFAPLDGLREGWIAGEGLPDPAVVDATMATLWQASSPYVRLMEVTLNRGTELGGTAPQNPSIVAADEEGTTFERRTKVHSDFDWFLTRGFRIAPVASHDNHFANWGKGHTSRTVMAVAGPSQHAYLDAIEQREIYASEDENLALRFYVEGRIPMGSEWATPASTASARVEIADPDYDGVYSLRLHHGVVGSDGVSVIEEHSELSAGRHDLSLPLDGPGVHFFYLEVHEPEVDRMAWTAPIWIERL